MEIFFFIACMDETRAFTSISQIFRELSFFLRTLSQPLEIPTARAVKGAQVNKQPLNFNSKMPFLKKMPHVFFLSFFKVIHKIFLLLQNCFSIWVNN